MRRTGRGLCKGDTGQWSGFSLIEVMFVISIFGILTLLAIPQYRKYQAKSKTLEAKVVLVSIFTAEENFYLNKGYYSPCIGVLGVIKPRNNHYAVGFGATSSGPISTRKTGISSNRESCSYEVSTATTTTTATATTTPATTTTTPATTTGVLSYNADKYVYDGNLYTTPPDSGNVSMATGALLEGASASNGIATSCAVDAFVAGAVGNISSKGEWDKWSINNGKELVHDNEGY